MENAQSRFKIRSILTVVFGITFVIAAICRGNYLLGITGGLMYASAAACVFALFWETLSRSPVSKFRLLILLVFAIPVSIVFAFPTYWSPDLQHFVDLQSDARNARAELNQLFDSDPAFADLGVSTTKLKIVNVEIYGSVPTKSDLDRLKSQAIQQCQCVDDCLVYLRIHVHGEPQIYEERIERLDSSDQDPA